MLVLASLYYIPLLYAIRISSWLGPKRSSMKKGQVVQDIMIPPIQKLRQRGVSQLTSEDSMFGDDKEDGKFSKTLKRYDAYAKVRQLYL